MKKLKRLYLAAKETERVFPVADRHVRYVDQEMEVSGYRIPKGWTAMTSGSVSHRIETLFSDPLRYDPLRFERGEGKHPLSLIGFGGGKHKCTGMKFAYNEIVVWLAHVLRTFDLTLENPDPKVRDTDGVLVPGPTVVRYVRRK